MKKNIVEISFTGNNFSAYVPSLPGVVSVGDTPDEIKKNILEAIELHLQGMREDGDPIPEQWDNFDNITTKFDTRSLLAYYKGVLDKAAIGRLADINDKQLHHYASGKSKPRLAQRKKIESALHQLGAELMSVEL